MPGEELSDFAGVAAGKTPGAHPIGAKGKRGALNQYGRWPVAKQTLKGRATPREADPAR
jgi:hypothetical protein